MIKNKELLEKTDLFLYEVGLLLIIEQLPSKEIENKLKEQVFNNEGESDALQVLEQQGYLKHIKKKYPWNSVRLSNKGKDFVRELGELPLSDLSKECLDIMLQYYREYEVEGKIKNQKKTRYYINQWLDYKSTSKGIDYTVKQFEAVIRAYLDSFDYDEKKYVKNTLGLLFSPDNLYATTWYPESCPLEDFVQNNNQEIKNTYKKLWKI